LDSIDYYNKYANIYFDSTVELNMEETLDKFIGYLPESAEVLDLGCGSGRDSLYFIERGFDITAIDGSEELCELASIHIGQDVLHMQFAELDFKEVFDGVWACASLLHTTPNELEEVLGNVVKCLKPGGVLYMSFKHGEFSGFRNGRYFNDYKTKTMKELIAKQEELEIIEIWKSPDVRVERGNEVWLNILVKKIDDDKQE